jgi:hypothetical protein
VLIDIVTAALQRNYPETTPDKVEICSTSGMLVPF